MPAVVFTWVEISGTPVPPYSGVNYYFKIQIDLSGFIDYYKESGATNRTIGTGSPYFPARLHVADTKWYNGDIFAISNGPGWNITSPIVKNIGGATTVGVSNPLLNMTISKHYADPPSGIYNDYELIFTGFELVNASLGPATRKFAFELSSAIRTNLLPWYGELTKVPTHLIMWTDTGGTPIADWAWFEATVYDQDIHYCHPAIMNSSLDGLVTIYDYHVGNRGLVGTPMVSLKTAPDSGGPEIPIIPVIVGADTYYADRGAFRATTTGGDYIPLALGLTCRCYGLQTSNGAGLPSNEVTYYDAIGTALGTQFLSGTWTFIGVDSGSGLNVYQATDQTFNLTPPTGAVLWSFSGNNDYWLGYGHGWTIWNTGGVPYVPIQPYAYASLDGAGAYLPGILLRTYP